MRRTAGFRLITSVLVAVGVTLVSWAGLATGRFQQTQIRLQDALFPAVAPSPDIVIVGIDQDSLDAIKQQWPWPRSIHADLLDRFREGGARLVGYDVTFSSPSEPAEDRALARAVRESNNVVLAASAAFEGKLGGLPRATSFTLPIPAVAAGAAGIGHANVNPDPDGITRAVAPVIETPEGDLVPSLSFQLYTLRENLQGPVTRRPDGIQIGEGLVPTGPGHLMDVNFAEGFTTYSAIDVLRGNVPLDAFRDKIVLVGATALGLGDTRLTPLDKASGEPGVYVHANALNTMLTGAFLSPEGRLATLTWIFGISLLVALAVAFLPAAVSPFLALAMLVGYVLLVFRRFDSGHVMNLFYPAVGLALAYVAALGVKYFTEVRERRRVTSVFGRYVERDVVDEVLAAPDRALATLEGADRQLSILFADLRGFTAASEGAAPKEVVRALNVYLDAMVQAVAAERGTIDKFMGDCVMAFWGAPRPADDHARRAVRAAIEMQEEIDKAMAAGKTAGLQVKGCGVGVATGEAVVGNIGSQHRLDYTVVGDTVNTASRLCGVAGAGQIVVTEATADLVRDGFRLAPLPPLAVKGKVKPLTVFQVLREGQEAATFAEGAIMEAEEEKGAFQPAPAGAGQKAPAKAAGYAPVEPVAEPKPEEEG